jgi:DNA-binding GntR family transcriptional regulator
MTADQPASWLNVYDELKSSIRNGSLIAEASLDSHPLRATCTAQAWEQALRLLRQEGLVQADQMTVAKPRARSVRSTSFLADYSTQGRMPTIRTYDLDLADWAGIPSTLQEMAPASAAVPAFVRHFHLQAVDDIPHAICESFIPMANLGPAWSSIRDGQRDLSQLFRDAGLSETTKEERLVVDWATKDEAEKLELPAMAQVPVVRLWCAVWSGEALLELCTLVDRADLYEFRYRITVAG